MLHLEKEMRLNGLGTPDEVTLVPLNKVEPAPTKTEPKQAENRTQNSKKGYCFYCNKFGISRQNAEKCEETSGTKQGKTTAKQNTPLAPPSNVIHAGNLTKRRIAGIEPTRHMIRDPNDLSNARGKPIILLNNRRTK